MYDLADLAELDEELWGVGGNDENVGVSLDEDARFFFVGFAEVVAGGDGFGNAIVEVGGVADAGAVAALAAEVGETVRFSGVKAVHGLGQHEGQRVFPCAARAGQDERVGKAARAHGFAEVGDGGRIA